MRSIDSTVSQFVLLFRSIFEFQHYVAVEQLALREFFSVDFTGTE
jgi:hypothetical protein